MDNLRGTFDSADPAEDSLDWDASEEEVARDLPPDSIGQDERRMQVRAYNHWASLLGERNFPAIEDLEPENLPDFGPNSVVLDFSAGIDDPVVQFLGDKLADECGAEGKIDKLSDVPPRSLLSRITDHYMQILANQAPIGFEAEFVNQHGAAILYRGILLPFSSNDETIDFIYGVINWKEMADQVTADELLLEIDQALDNGEDAEAVEEHPIEDGVEPETEAKLEPEAVEAEVADEPEPVQDAPEPVASLTDGLDLRPEDELADELADGDLPMPDFGEYALPDPEEEDEDEELPGYNFASLSDYIEAPTKKAIDLDAIEFDESAYDQDAPFEEDALPEPVELNENAGLHDCLASARELAENARVSEDRSRHALYAAVGRAYDFSLAAKDEPEAYEELIEESGLSVQDRAPMTPVVKLVFGSDYDKTRLTEYAAVLSHAHRLGLERGSLAGYLGEAEGGLKGVVNAERRLRREEAGKTVEPTDGPRAALAKKLRELEAMMFEALEADGPEFALVMIRRSEENGVEMLGEIEQDIPLIERAARKLVG